MAQELSSLLLGKGHLTFAARFLRQGLPASAIDQDPTRLVIAFYCIATLDILGGVETFSKEWEREEWRKWLWVQQVQGAWGAGFRPSPYMDTAAASEYDPPMLVMTYAALLSLAILRDPFTSLDRDGLLKYLKVSQQQDGSFQQFPESGECDLRMSYCAFAICSFLNDWSAINVESAVKFIQRCRTYEGGYGQEPGNEASGGPTYCALAALDLAPINKVTPEQRKQTVRWLLYNQHGGFSGRTNKPEDPCYCFWNGASIAILGDTVLANDEANAKYLLGMQAKYGGIKKDAESHPDPYHTYLSLASLSVLSNDSFKSLIPHPLDSLWNATSETKKWMSDHLHKS